MESHTTTQPQRSPRHAFIKICGMTDARAVEAALAAGVDAIGFVFAPSVRQVSPQQALELARPARGRALCVAVTLHPDATLLRDILTQFQPDVWQSDAEDIAAARASGVLPKNLATWPVLRGASAAQSSPATTAFTPHAGQRVLFEGPKSGTGQVADWNAARELARRCELILAGGLSPQNVAEAIAQVRPFGVDVSSGVEESPGRKSPVLIESLVSLARAAFAQLG
jgi:phosphoribosylanthranilate isomerase